MQVLSATLVHGRAELRAHLVTGAAPGTPVRQTGWATTPDGPTAQLHPVRGYDETVRHAATGSTLMGPRTRTAYLDGTVAESAAGTLFLALASLTADASPAPVDTLATVAATGDGIQVTWQDGTRTRLPFPVPPAPGDTA